MFNIVASELVFAAAFLGVLVLTWPHPPWNALLYGGVAIMLVAPFVFYPFSKTLFLGFRPHLPSPDPGGLRPTDRQPAIRAARTGSTS